MDNKIDFAGIEAEDVSDYIEEKLEFKAQALAEISDNAKMIAEARDHGAYFAKRAAEEEDPATRQELAARAGSCKKIEDSLNERTEELTECIETLDNVIARLKT